jgi:L-rhamnose-H+ transport protein
MHTTGLLLIVLGGVMEGLFVLPMRFTPKWAWENIWGAGSLAALILVPWPLALLTVPHLGSVYSAAPMTALLLAVLYGAGWGCGGVFFGLGMSRLGLSLGTSLIMGLIAIGGSVVPLLLEHNHAMPGRGSAGLAAGIGLMVAGLMVCARAGSLKSVDAGGAKAASSFGLGLLYCAAAGLLSALVNFALIFGAPVAQPAIARGLDAATANNAVWALVFTSNFLVNLGYCIFLCARNKTFGKFSLARTAHYWLLAVVMGGLWAGGIVVYGRGASIEGALGPVFGFPIMLITSILTGNGAGAMLGEWRGAPGRARATMTWGVCIMVLAILTFGYANYAIRL